MQWRDFCLRLLVMRGTRRRMVSECTRVWKDPVQGRRQVRLDNRGQGDPLDMGRVPRGNGLSAVGDLLLLSIFRCPHLVVHHRANELCCAAG
jgi:hypothetical protein